MEEMWKDIEGYEGFYQVSNLGNVRSLDRYVKNRMSNKNIKRGKILKSCINKHGYLAVHLIKETKGQTKTVHRLVANAFIPNPENKPEVNHIDGNKQNNILENLEWVTSSENTLHAIKTGLIKKLNGRNHYKTPVNQYSLDNKFIKQWDSIKQINEEWNLKSIHVSACCRGKIKTSLGYKWKYVE